MRRSIHALCLTVGVLQLMLLAAPILGPTAARAAPISGMSFWLDASDLSTFPAIGGGGGVNNWNDKSGNNYNLSNTGLLSTKPTRTTVAGYNLPVVHFDGGDTINDLTGAAVYSGGVQTVFMVFTASKGAEQDVFDATPTGITRRLIYTDSTGINLFRGGGGGDIANNNYTAGDQLVFSAVLNGSSSATWINGLNQVTGTISNTAATTTRVDVSSTVNSNLFTGDIAEILVYNSVLSVADRQSNEQYLIAKWLPEPGGALFLFLTLPAAMARARRRLHTKSIQVGRRKIAGLAGVFGFLLLMLVSAAPPVSAATSNYEIFVSGYNSNNIVRYNNVTSVVSTLSNGAGGLTHPDGLVVGADDLVYATSGTTKILRYSPATAAYNDTFNSTNSNTPIGLAFDSAGKLYVTNLGNPGVNRLNTNGTLDTNFISFTTYTSGYRGRIGPDGNFYLPDFQAGRVRKYDSTGASLNSSFIISGSTGPVDLAWADDGSIYMAQYTLGQILHYTAGGTLIGTAISGLNNPYGLVFAPDGELYVSSYTDSTVKRYTITAGVGTLDATVITSANGITNAAGIDVRLLPEPGMLGFLTIVPAALARTRRTSPRLASRGL